MKKNSILLIVLVVMVSFLWALITVPNENLKVVVCDVGQGDASLVTKGRFQVLIDGGPDETKLLECLGKNMWFFDHRIEVVVMTHPQEDHGKGLTAVLDRYRVEKLIVSAYGNQEFMKNIREKVVSSRGIEVLLPQFGLKIKSNDMVLTTLWPRKKVGNNRFWSDATFSDKVEVDDPNQTSVVIELKWRNFSSIFSGDISRKEEQALVDSRVLDQVTLLKVPHHGSKTSSSMEFLRVLKPEVSVISVGKKNSFGHPSVQVVERLQEVGSQVWRTDESGTVVIETDGQSWWARERR